MMLEEFIKNSNFLTKEETSIIKNILDNIKINGDSDQSEKSIKELIEEKNGKNIKTS